MNENPYRSPTTDTETVKAPTVKRQRVLKGILFLIMAIASFATGRNMVIGEGSWIEFAGCLVGIPLLIYVTRDPIRSL